MKYRTLGRTEFTVSEVSLGTWQVGGRWGEPFDEVGARKILNDAIDGGVTFIDTADVYSGGLSERVVAKVAQSRTEEVHVATKCGRRISPHVSDGYTSERLIGFVEDSLRNMGLETLDLIQLHCPPTEVYYRPEIFETFERLKTQGKIRNLGVSVEKVEEALKAVEYSNVTTVQIIFNMFRLRPSELFFEQAKRRNIGVIVRVPLASGLLTGKFSRDTVFGKGDHRFFNRRGASFDKGETFAGVDYETGLAAVEELKALFGDDGTLAQWAIRWILMFDAVSCVIPGASRADQVTANLEAANLPPLTSAQMDRVKQIYENRIKPTVHSLW
jgi:aryl-alcohol dehydrogenase-like predicted oxidoreductase